MKRVLVYLFIIFSMLSCTTTNLKRVSSIDELSDEYGYVAGCFHHDNIISTNYKLWLIEKETGEKVSIPFSTTPFYSIFKLPVGSYSVGNTTGNYWVDNKESVVHLSTSEDIPQIEILPGKILYLGSYTITDNSCIVGRTLSFWSESSSYVDRNYRIEYDYTIEKFKKRISNSKYYSSIDPQNIVEQKRTNSL